MLLKSVSNQTYGWIFALITLGFIGLSQLNRLFSKFYSQQQIVFVALTFMVILSVIFLYGLLQGGFNIVGKISKEFLKLSHIFGHEITEVRFHCTPANDDVEHSVNLFYTYIKLANNKIIRIPHYKDDDHLQATLQTR
jgi:hypothetical protein